jgi:hypothetical protein
MLKSTLKKKRIALMLVIGLIIGVTGACGTKTEYVFVKPECSVPPMPADLPEPDVDYIYDNLGNDVAEQLRKRERLIVDSLLEHRAILKEICNGQNTTEND